VSERASVDVDRINGFPRTVRDLFTARKCSVDYCQREYAWTQANVTELIEDLSGRFLEAWDESHERKDVVRVTGRTWAVWGKPKWPTVTALRVRCLMRPCARSLVRSRPGRGARAGRCSGPAGWAAWP
jgi:hypothetical protein